MSGFVHSTAMEGKEDRCAVFACGASAVAVVADGVGGTSGGAEAAEAVIRAVREAPASADWREVLLGVDARLARGETTAVVAEWTEAGIAGASVGDSGAWVIGPAGHLDLTADQRRKPRIGTGEAVPVPFSDAGTEGTLLLASDGLLGYADPARICAVARGGDLEAAARALVECSRLPSGELPDDVSVVLVRRRV